MTPSSQFIQVLTSVLKKDPLALPSEDALLLQPQGEASSERFFYRNFATCRLPINLYDRQGKRQIHNLVTDVEDGFATLMRMPERSASGCAFVVNNGALYFVYDRMERWSDVPNHVAFVAVRLDPERITSLAANEGETRLTPTEYLMVSHLLTGLDLKAVAALLGTSYDTKRKQSQIILDKLGAKTQTDLLRSLSLEITAAVFDEILPLQERNLETALVKRQFRKDVIVNTISIGDGPDIPVWEFGARCGRPVLYFHSMLTPIVFHDEMIDLLKAHDLRWLVVPRHFLGLDDHFDVQTRQNKFTHALAQTVAHLSDDPVICVAESAGVPWAAHFARHHSHLVSQLVLAATPQVFQMVEQPKKNTLFIEMSQRLRRDDRVIAGLTHVYNAISRIPALAQKGLMHMCRKSAADMACMENLFQRAHLSDWLRLIANHATMASVDELTNLQRNWLEDLKETTCQMMFIHGKEDPISPIQDVQAIARTLPDATFQAIDDAGHMVLTQHFEALISQLATQDAQRRVSS